MTTIVINFNKQIREYLDTVKIDIQSELRIQEFEATGSAINSLRVVANQYLIGELRGVVHLNFLVKGFKTKPLAVSRAFIDNIILWMQARNIMPKRKGVIVPATYTNITRSAFSIAKGIVDKGTPVTRGEKGVDIIRILNDNLPDYLEGVASDFLLNFKDKIK